MTLPPWEYLFEAFNRRNFPDLFNLTWIAALGLLIVLVVLYITRTRALHRHAPYLEMWEWIWWTGLITFSMILIACGRTMKRNAFSGVMPSDSAASSWPRWIASIPAR